MSSSNVIDVVKNKINSILSKYPQFDEPLSRLAGSIGVDKPILALGIVLVPLLIIFVVGVGHFLIDIVGFAYPLYASIKAIESADKEDDTQWLTYWMVFALFKLIEDVADVFVSAIPFYFFIKLAFLVWCYYPSTRGAKVIYTYVVKPHIVPYLGLSSTPVKKDN